MYQRIRLGHRGTVAASLLAMGLGTFGARGDLVVDAFDTDAAVAKWSATWGTSPTLAFDTQNAGGGATGSGSLKVSADYFTAADDGWEQRSSGP